MAPHNCSIPSTLLCRMLLKYSLRVIPTIPPMVIHHELPSSPSNHPSDGHDLPSSPSNHSSNGHELLLSSPSNHPSSNGHDLPSSLSTIPPVVISSLCLVLPIIPLMVVMNSLRRLVYVVARSLSLYDDLQTHHRTHNVLLGLATSDGHTSLHHIVMNSLRVLPTILPMVMISLTFFTIYP
jgi:hypothetical protein